MFFKSKVSVDEFALMLLQMHAAIFGITALSEICQLVEVHFRDDDSHAAAFTEWFAFGLYSVSQGVKVHCSARQAILDSMNSQVFAHLAKTEAGADDLSVRILKCTKEYHDLSMHSAVEALAVQRIFDKPAGALLPQSMQAFELRILLQERWSGAMKGVERLAGRFTIIQ